jgi:hypothetical protein
MVITNTKIHYYYHQNKMYHIISPCANNRIPEPRDDGLVEITISYTYDTIEELMSHVRRFNWYKQYDYKSNDDLIYEQRQKELASRPMSPMNDEQLKAYKEYNDFFDTLCDPDETSEAPEQFVGFVDNREYFDFTEIKNKYFDEIEKELNQLELNLQSDDKEMFIKRYGEVGMNMDCCTLIIAVTNKQTRKDEHDVINVTREHNVINVTHEINNNVIQP